MKQGKDKKIEFNKKWFKSILRMKGISVLDLGKERGGTIWSERTIRRSLDEGRISLDLLDAIAQKLELYPPYLAGKYCWTLELPVMELPGVKEYWLKNFLKPESYPYIRAEQERLGTYRLFLNTLLIHGISEENYKSLEIEDRRRLESQIDRKTTELLQHWFPEADFADRVDYYLAMDWETDADVMDALLDYLIEQGYAKGEFPDDDDDNPHGNDHHLDA